MGEALITRRGGSGGYKKNDVIPLENLGYAVTPITGATSNKEINYVTLFGVKDLFARTIERRNFVRTLKFNINDEGLCVVPKQRKVGASNNDLNGSKGMQTFKFSGAYVEKIVENSTMDPMYDLSDDGSAMIYVLFRQQSDGNTHIAALNKSTLSSKDGGWNIARWDVQLDGNSTIFKHPTKDFLYVGNSASNGKLYKLNSKTGDVMSSVEMGGENYPIIKIIWFKGELLCFGYNHSLKKIFFIRINPDTMEKIGASVKLPITTTTHNSYEPENLTCIEAGKKYIYVAYEDFIYAFDVSGRQIAKTYTSLNTWFAIVEYSGVEYLVSISYEYPSYESDKLLNSDLSTILSLGSYIYDIVYEPCWIAKDSENMLISQTGEPYNYILFYKTIGYKVLEVK